MIPVIVYGYIFDTNDSEMSYIEGCLYIGTIYAIILRN